jgi:nucleoside-diphosphate-sugar epimerase
MKFGDGKLLVTGAGGFIGRRLVERALFRGVPVRGLERDPVRAAALARQGVEVITGDVGDVEVAARALEGAGAVVHAAALVREGGTLAEFRPVNVEASATLCRVARRAGCTRFVHVSSVMVYGFSYPPDVDESGPLRGENNPYCQTKIEGELAVNCVHEPPDFQVVVVRPGDVYGPGSGPWVVRPLELMRRGRFLLPDGGHGTFNHVYIDNLVDALELALDARVPGQTFNVTDGEPVSFRDYFTRLAALAGLPPPRSAPAPLVRTLLGAVALAQRALGREPSVSPSAVDFLRRPHAVSAQRAREQLGFRPAVSLDEGLARTGAWLRSEGLAPLAEPRAPVGERTPD